MREIKFRSWDKSAKKMSNLYNLQKQPTFNSEYNGKFCISTIRPSDWLGFDSLSENERQIAMQYTGLKDKNGVEIYEGDICKTVHSAFRDDDNTIGIVEFYNGRFLRKIKYPSGQYNYHDLFNFHCEVIGNIYENKDLLKKI